MFPILVKSNKIGLFKKSSGREQIGRKLTAYSNICAQYIEFMEEYMKLAHVQKVLSGEELISDETSLYLPYHDMFRTDNHKIRTVFNASRKTTTIGLALNDKLMVGPTIQSTLVDIIQRCCAISKSFFVQMHRKCTETFRSHQMTPIIELSTNCLA